MKNIYEFIPVSNKLDKCYNNDKTVLTLTRDEKHLLRNAVFPQNLKRVIFEYDVIYSDIIHANFPTSVYSLQFSCNFDVLLVNNLPENIEELVFLQLSVEIHHLLFYIKRIVVLCNTMDAVENYIKKVPFGCVVTDGNGKIYL